jgi:hypothetical protein
LKDAEESRGFTFITGITKFAQASVFPKLNNLDDLTLDMDYADICGLAMDDFDAFFANQMSVHDPGDHSGRPKKLVGFISEGFLPQDATKEDLRKEILARYDGYSWDGKSRL